MTPSAWRLQEPNPNPCLFCWVSSETCFTVAEKDAGTCFFFLLLNSFRVCHLAALKLLRVSLEVESVNWWKRRRQTEEGLLSAEVAWGGRVWSHRGSGYKRRGQGGRESGRKAGFQGREYSSGSEVQSSRTLQHPQECDGSLGSWAFEPESSSKCSERLHSATQGSK